jgi:hypothetical protein
MRTVIVGVLLASVTSSLEAQVRDSTYWTIGVARSFMDGQTIASRSSQSGGSMQFEWRTEGKRLGIRTEVGVAQQDRYFDVNSSSGGTCAMCFSDQRRSHVMAVTSAVFEWRQDRMVRPYVIGGAGVARYAYRNTTNYAINPGVVSGSPAYRIDHDAEENRTYLGFVTAYGFGLSLNSERFGAFAEARGRAGGAAAAGIGERFSVGMRVRPN